MKSVKMACVHPAALQLFQKLGESKLGSGSKGGATGEGEEEMRDTQMVSGWGGEMAKLEHRGEPVALWRLDWSGDGEGGVLVVFCCGAEGPAVC